MCGSSPHQKTSGGNGPKSPSTSDGAAGSGSFFLSVGIKRVSLEGSKLTDPPEEILSNKLCALLSRSEVRDLVDVRALEMAGYRVEDALPAAKLKDSGLTPAQLGWVLSEITLGDDLVPPGNVSAEELREYLADLTTRLARIAFPG
ncbi:MAG TPA: nucleotidyl transferase AbiEii/AbiGii toxin family protein [Blastocatellia bacterium]|nr:nucleotidyl transferase AbiEii/AbiGii toxin family protein [Blastocatellia bacterium]